MWTKSMYVYYPLVKTNIHHAMTDYFMSAYVIQNKQ